VLYPLALQHDLLPAEGGPELRTFGKVQKVEREEALPGHEEVDKSGAEEKKGGVPASPAFSSQPPHAKRLRTEGGTTVAKAVPGTNPATVTAASEKPQEK